MAVVSLLIHVESEQNLDKREKGIEDQIKFSVYRVCMCICICSLSLDKKVIS